MIDFATWSILDAREYRDAYVASLPSRKEWLVAEISARGDDPDMLSRGVSGLGPLWAWATDLIDTAPKSFELRASQPSEDRQPGLLPPWYDQTKQDPLLSNGALWLIELLGGHLASVVIDARPAAHWVLYQAPGEADSYFQHRTLLFDANPRPMEPAAMVHTSVVGHVLGGKPWREQPTLSSLYEFIISE